MAVRSRAAAALAAALLTFFTSVPLQAQTADVAISPPGRERWDAAVAVSWLGVNQSTISAPWDAWFGAASVSGSAGFYVTPHVKWIADVATATKGHVYADPEQVRVPGLPSPIFISREYEVQRSSISTGVAYQFLENRWVHPFLAAGVALERDARRSVIANELRFPIDPRLDPGLSSSSTSVSYRVRPRVGGGFKAYMTERTFFQMNVGLSVGDGLQQIGWGGGFGVDF